MKQFLVACLYAIAGVVSLTLIAAWVHEYTYRYSQERNAFGPPYKKYGRRFWLTALIGVTGLLDLTVGNRKWGIGLSIAFALLIMPVVLNALVVIGRMARAAYYRFCLNRVSNPLLDIYNAGPRGTDDEPFLGALRTVAKYAWAVPNPEAVSLIASKGPIVEIGAGTGYWSWMLWQAGVDVVAYDQSPGPTLRNKFHRLKCGWFPVRKSDGGEAVIKHADRTLFMSWPSNNRMAFETLRKYGGKCLIYIGANSSRLGVYTGDPSFHDLLKQEWQLVHRMELATWGNLTDAVRVYWRKSPAFEAPKS